MLGKISILFFILIFMTVSCGEDFESRILLKGVFAESFELGHVPSLDGKPAIEASVLTHNNESLIFYDPAHNGSFSKASSKNPFSEKWANQKNLGSNFRFPYTLKFNNKFYTFANENEKDIYLYESSDGDTWSKINGGNPVLSHSTDTSSIYNRVWNVGVAIDSSNTWHMLIECASGPDNQPKVGLAYSSATLVGTNIDFNTGKSATHVIPDSGNPAIVYVPEEDTLLALHGVISPRSWTSLVTDNGYWHITASSRPVTSSTWTTHSDKLYIGLPILHVADPHISDLPSNNTMKTIITFSYDQNRMYEIYSKKTILELLRTLTK